MFSATLPPFVQGSKRENERAEAQAKGELRTWTKGAPRSHKSTGVGQGAGTQRGAKGRFEAVPDVDKPRDKELPTSVPMPSRVEDITNTGMRAMVGDGWRGSARASRLVRSEVCFVHRPMLAMWNFMILYICLPLIE